MAHRFPPTPDDQLTPSQRELVSYYRSGPRKSLAVPDGGLGGPLHVTLRSPCFARTVMASSDCFREQSRIPVGVKELVTSLIAKERQFAFQWDSHVFMELAAELAVGASAPAIKSP